MLTIDTRNCGRLGYGAEAVLSFPAGLYAFADQKEFLLIEQPDSAPIVFLQSLREPGLSFVMLPVQVVDPAYRLTLTEEEVRALGFLEGYAPQLGRDITCLVLLTVGRDTHHMQSSGAYSHQSRQPSRCPVHSVRFRLLPSASAGCGGGRMLLIRRRVGESILLGENIEIQVIDITPSRVKLGIIAQREVPVLRKEIRLSAEQNRAASVSLTPETIASLVSRLRQAPIGR